MILRFHLILVEMTIINNTKSMNAGEDVEEKEHVYKVGGNVN
jgi:hypothetical protein